MSDISEAYLNLQVESSDPAQLTELLYRRAIRDLHSAVELWPELKVSPKAIHLIVHAQSIIRELYGTLNFKDGGNLAVELGRIYEYIQFTLTETVKRRETELPIEYHTAVGLLEEISNSWSQMLRERNQGEYKGEIKELVA